MTPQRAAVLAAVRAAGDHPTAAELHRRVRARLPGIGVATVYRTLDLLVRDGTVLALQAGDNGVTRYDGATHRHAHVHCRDCGAVADVGLPLPASLLAAASAASGFAVDSCELSFSGRCPDCTCGQRMEGERCGRDG